MTTITDRLQQVDTYPDFQQLVTIRKDSHVQQHKCSIVLQMLLLDMDLIRELLKIQSFLMLELNLRHIPHGIVDLVDKDFHVQGSRQ